MNRCNDDVVNYVVNDIVQSNNSDINSNNEDNGKVHTNRYYDDMHNNLFKYYDDCGNNKILSFYLLWIHIQVRVSDNDHSNVIVDHHACNRLMIAIFMSFMIQYMTIMI